MDIHQAPQALKRDSSCAGVLYLPPPPLFTVASGSYGVPTPTLAREQQPAPSAPLPRFAHPGMGAVTRRGRSARRDPLEPKQNKTPFNFFSIDARARAKAEHPTADQKVSHPHALGFKVGLRLPPLRKDTQLLCCLYDCAHTQRTGKHLWLQHYFQPRLTKLHDAWCRRSARLLGTCGKRHSRTRRPPTSSRSALANSFGSIVHQRCAWHICNPRLAEWSAHFQDN